jgi:hypothetical protein
VPDVHKWIARYEAGRLPALADRSHRPQSYTHQSRIDLSERRYNVMASALHSAECDLPLPGIKTPFPRAFLPTVQVSVDPG